MVRYGIYKSYIDITFTTIRLLVFIDIDISLFSTIILIETNFACTQWTCDSLRDYHATTNYLN